MKSDFSKLFIIFLLICSWDLPGLEAQTIQNPSFELPVVSGSYKYNPTGAVWTFTGDAGVAANGSAFMPAGHPYTPYGNQFAFLQSASGVVGTMSQTVSNSVAGNQSVYFIASQRDAVGSSVETEIQTITVLVDGVSVGSFTPADVNWHSLQTSPVWLNVGNHVLTFTNLPAAGDATAFVDAVQLASGFVNFAATPTNGTSPLTVHFSAPITDSSGVSIVGWNWNFGDGTTSSAQNPIHTYTNAGIFSPGLSAVNVNGLNDVGFGPTIRVWNYPVLNLSNIGNLSETNGLEPQCRLVLSNGVLYGTTTGGGAYGSGVVFSVNVDGTGWTVLHNFSGGVDGSSPVGGLVLNGNSLYGTASGGASGSGTIFALNTDGTGFQVLHTFSPVTNSTNSDGAVPLAGLTLIGNTLYGVASQGGFGTGGTGTIFSLNTDGSNFKTMYSFTSLYTGEYLLPPVNSDGANPDTTLVSLGNTLYGTAPNAGPNRCGSIFAITADGSQFTVLSTFSAYPVGSGGFPARTNVDGGTPNGGLVLLGNTLYGTTGVGGPHSCGTQFQLNTNGSSFNVLYNFGTGNGSANLSIEDDTLYCTASSGGAFGDGFIFVLNTDGTGYKDIYDFSGGYDGAVPLGGLVRSGDTLYGVASQSGGSIFALKLAAIQSVELTANPSNGPVPLTVQFTSPSTNRTGAAITEWAWNFGDGATSSAQNPSHTYTNPGTFGPHLVVSANDSKTSYGMGPLIEANPDPVSIVSQPTSVPAAYGFPATISVAASGTAIQYQWFFGSSPISGATNSSLTVTNVGDSNVGTYYLVVSNAVSSIESQPIQLFVSTAVRIFPTASPQNLVGYWPNVPVTNTIEVAPPAGVTSYVVQDQFSVLNDSDFFYNVQNISSSGHFDAVHGIVKWVFLDGNPRTLTYQIVPGNNATNWMTFSGLVSIDGTNIAISGDSQMNLLPLHPADNEPPIIGQIGGQDMIDYYGDYLTGANWPVEPSLDVPGGIPPEYVSSAISLWQGGQYYTYQASRGSPPACWVNTPPSSGTALQAMAAKLRSSVAYKANGATPLDSTQSTAVCSMPNVYTNNVPFMVTEVVSPATNVIAYAVEDQVPVGWTVTNILVDGATAPGQTAFDSYNSQVDWGPFGDDNARTLTYQLTPATNASGPYTFSGTVVVANQSSIPITGVRQVNIYTVPVPGISSIRLSGANLLINGTNGSSGNPYITLMSTNLSLPLSQWTPVATNTLNTGGNFTITATNVVTPQTSQQFYRLYQP